jgi:hypothetical protein
MIFLFFSLFCHHRICEISANESAEYFAINGITSLPGNRPKMPFAHEISSKHVTCG